ncbi:hypothetical protein MNV49_000756 [Pseudohyphozyma bogoriensis]|nr:hypothetical protein MNV49_000756 [Pseudohyphozyma bogoriensis]
MTFSWLQFGVILFAAVGSLTYGYAAGVISTTLGQPTFLEYFALDTRPDSTAYTSALVVGFQCGGFIGALASPYFADRWGRKLVLYVSAAGVIALAAIQAGSISLKMFLVARTLGGLPVGGILVAVPLYQAEIAPAKLRGQLMAMHGMMLALGYVISSWLSLAFYYVPNSSVSWRVPLALQAVFPAVLVVGLTWLPESPRWLISKDKGSQAQKILDLLHQDPDAVDPLHTSHYEFKAIVEQNELEKTRDVSWGAILRTPSYRKRAILAFLSLFIYPSTGTLTITNYLPSLLAKLGFGASQQLALAGGYITYAPLGNVVASYLLDRFGRKRMFFIGLTGCVLALTGETIVIAKGLDTKAGQGIGVFFFFMHLVFFATFLDSTTFVYAAEIWPTHLRAKGFSIGISGLFLGSIIWLGAAPTAFASINELFYIVFIANAVVLAGVIWKFFPETANVPLEAMGILFGDATVAEDTSGEKQETQHVEHTSGGMEGSSTGSNKDLNRAPGTSDLGLLTSAARSEDYFHYVEKHEDAYEVRRDMTPAPGTEIPPEELLQILPALHLPSTSTGAAPPPSHTLQLLSTNAFLPTDLAVPSPTRSATISPGLSSMPPPIAERDPQAEEKDCSMMLFNEYLNYDWPSDDSEEDDPDFVKNDV